MDPTVEPDPDNTGGGKKAVSTSPSAEGIFISALQTTPVFSVTKYKNQTINLTKGAGYEKVVICLFVGASSGHSIPGHRRREPTCSDLNDPRQFCGQQGFA
jgi:hypothetical protein